MPGALNARLETFMQYGTTFVNSFRAIWSRLCQHVFFASMSDEKDNPLTAKLDIKIHSGDVENKFGPLNLLGRDILQVRHGPD